MSYEIIKLGQCSSRQDVSQCFSDEVLNFQWQILIQVVVCLLECQCCIIDLSSQILQVFFEDIKGMSELIYIKLLFVKVGFTFIQFFDVSFVYIQDRIMAFKFFSMRIQSTTYRTKDFILFSNSNTDLTNLTLHFHLIFCNHICQLFLQFNLLRNEIFYKYLKPFRLLILLINLLFSYQSSLI